jgi:hypothetical protein
MQSMRNARLVSKDALSPDSGELKTTNGGFFASLAIISDSKSKSLSSKEANGTRPGAILLGFGTSSKR